MFLKVIHIVLCERRNRANPRHLKTYPSKRLRLTQLVRPLRRLMIVPLRPFEEHSKKTSWNSASFLPCSSQLASVRAIHRKRLVTHDHDGIRRRRVLSHSRYGNVVPPTRRFLGKDAPNMSPAVILR